MTRWFAADVVGQHGNPAVGDRHDAADQSRLGRLGEGHGAVGVGDQRPAPEVGHAADHLDILLGHRVAGGGAGNFGGGRWYRELHSFGRGCLRLSGGGESNRASERGDEALFVCCFHGLGWLIVTLLLAEQSGCLR